MSHVPNGRLAGICCGKCTACRMQAPQSQKVTRCQLERLAEGVFQGAFADLRDLAELR